MPQMRRAAGLLLTGFLSACATGSGGEFLDLSVVDLTPPPAAAPAFSLTDVNPNSPTRGQAISLAGLAGKAVFIVFHDASCAPCQTQAASLNRFRANKGASGPLAGKIEIVAINHPTDTGPAAINAYCSMITMPLAQDTAAAQVRRDVYKAQLFDQFVIDPAGGLARSYTGANALNVEFQDGLDKLEKALLEVNGL
jgi:hypothetical protein